MHATSPLAIFILQLILIIITCQVFAYAFKKLGQPAVVGEIIAGIALGPSLLGMVLPEVSAFVFPTSSLGNLQMISQIGLILFMFVIGMELDLNIIRKKAGSALLISNISIVFPFLLGMGLAYFLHKDFAPSGIPFYAFALFMGIAMSITAFPVLARIIRERGIMNTRMGTIAITSAAIGDVTGWCVLAFVIAIAKADALDNSFYSLIGAAVYVFLMILLVRPMLKSLSKHGKESQLLRRSTMPIIFLTLLGSSYVAEIIGIHALFGAFMAGIIMPLEWNFRNVIINKIEDVSVVLLLPIFFVLTGLRTQVNLLNDSSLWSICLIIIAIAVIGKFAGSTIAARITGESIHDSLAIGALMNTRGLMELIILNIGFDLGILSPEIFTMMVIMALVTTMMTNPILNLLDRRYAKAKEPEQVPLANY